MSFVSRFSNVGRTKHVRSADLAGLAAAAILLGGFAAATAVSMTDLHLDLPRFTLGAPAPSEAPFGDAGYPTRSLDGALAGVH